MPPSPSLRCSQQGQLYRPPAAPNTALPVGLPRHLLIPRCPGSAVPAAALSPQTRIHQAGFCHPPLTGDPAEGQKLPPPIAWGLPQGPLLQTGAPPCRVCLLAHTEAHLPGPPYPVLFLPALSVSLLPFHLQGDGGQAVLRTHQFLRQRRLLGLLQGQGLGEGREQRAWGQAGALPLPCPGKRAHWGLGALSGSPQVGPGWRCRLTPPVAPGKGTTTVNSKSGHGLNLEILLTCHDNPCPSLSPFCR